MTKRTCLTLLLFTLITLLVANKYLYLTKYHIPFFSVSNNKVRVDIENKSEKNIEQIKFSPQNITVKNIEKGKRKTVTFKHKGEGSYQLVVKFEAERDSLITTKYIESGYFITETILNNTIHSTAGF